MAEITEEKKDLGIWQQCKKAALFIMFKTLPEEG